MELIVVGIILSLMWHVFSALKHYTVYDNSFLRTNRDYHVLSIIQWFIFLLALSIDKLPNAIMLGSFFVGHFISEVLLARYFYGRWFPRRCDYGIAHMFFDKKWKYDFMLLIVGIILLTVPIQHLF